MLREIPRVLPVQTVRTLTGYRALRYVLTALLLFIFCCTPEVQAVDEENCLFCHKYRGLSYISNQEDKEEPFRLLYVTEDLYLNSPHGNLKCSSCHTDIDKFPHGEIKKVDCLIVCHIDEPSSGLPFSHQRVEEHLSRSAHSRYDEEGNLKEHQDDYPDCITCHQDPLYRELAFLNENMPGLEQETIQRCSICHEEQAFMRKFYSHFTSQDARSLRRPPEIIEMCGTCHGDTEMMKRHGLSNLIKSYQETSAR